MIYDFRIFFMFYMSNKVQGKVELSRSQDPLIGHNIIHKMNLGHSVN